MKVDHASEAWRSAADGIVPVLVSPQLPDFEQLPTVVVDARMAKVNIDTSIGDAALVVALGPGFEAGIDCDLIVETKRGHDLGRVISKGSAAPDTGVPGSVGGVTEERVVRAPADGPAVWEKEIGDLVEVGEVLGHVGRIEVIARTDGVVRGLIASGRHVSAGTKIGDVDPRADRSACFTISDKSRLVGAGVLTAVLSWIDRGES